MASTEKQVSYQTTNSYSTFNTLTSATKNAWFACHGLGYLSRYFIRYFENLDEHENYIISPQAPSKYYQGNEFRHVGANWLTRENTQEDIKNVLQYLDAVFAAENIPKEKKLILFGYSQGVSVITRWLATRKLDCAVLVLHSGGIPKELTSEDFKFMTNTKVFLLYGTEDEYLTEARVAEETAHAHELFGNKVEIIPFEGKHEVNRELIAKIAGLDH